MIDIEPDAWRIFDGEGSYNYRETKPIDMEVSWSKKYGRNYEPLYSAKKVEALLKAERRKALLEAAEYHEQQYGHCWELRRMAGEEE